MTHDENVYPEPFAFKPERFFDKTGNLNDDARILAYGFGRRFVPSFTPSNFDSHTNIEFVLASTSQAHPLVFIMFSKC